MRIRSYIKAISIGVLAGTSWAAAAAAQDKLSVVQVASGALGDGGIFDSGDAGLKRAVADLGIEYKLIEGQQRANLLSDFLTEAADQGKVIFVNPGYQFDSFLPEVAAQHPDTTFVYTDGVAPGDTPNVVSISYAEHEGSYLAGILGAMMTTRTDIAGINADKVLGIVGAFDNPVINNFITGFKQGAASVDPEVKVEVRYAGSYSDPAKGKELALALYDAGADIVYQVAATTGDGVILAAKERKQWAIGVDTDKCSQGPDVVLSSMIKDVGRSYYEFVKDYVAGTAPKSGAIQFGLARGGVGMTYDSDCTKKNVPADIVAAMQAAQAKIIAGDISITSTK
jgi:basic membrane protein A